MIVLQRAELVAKGREQEGYRTKTNSNWFQILKSMVITQTDFALQSSILQKRVNSVEIENMECYLYLPGQGGAPEHQ